MHYRILAQTAPSPSLPYVTSMTTDGQVVATLREALDALFSDPATAGTRDMLGLAAVHRVNHSSSPGLAAGI